MSNSNQSSKIIGCNELKQSIDKLTLEQQTEVFRIIKKNSEKFSTNQSGIFANLNNFNKSTLLELSNFIRFCENNKTQLKTGEDKLAIFKTLIHS